MKTVYVEEGRAATLARGLARGLPRKTFTAAFAFAGFGHVYVDGHGNNNVAQ